MTSDVDAHSPSPTHSADLVSAARGEVDIQLGRLRGYLSSIGAGWTGVDQRAFAQVMIRWDEDASRIIAALNEVESRLRQECA